MLDTLKPLIDAGFAVLWLRPKEKRPYDNDWTELPVAALADLRASYRCGNNAGVRLGEPSRVADHYLHVIDLDVRDPALTSAAHAALRGFIPEYDTLPFVISGSGGESRHFYFLTERPFRSRKLAHSFEKITGADGKVHWAWEVELFGTGKQVVLPPSIHPDTGKPYVWGRPLDLADLDLGCGPFIGQSRVAEWAPLGTPDTEGDDDGMSALVAAKPMGLSREEIDRTLAALPIADWCDDRDGWLTVGMALHHEFGGSADGLKVWNAFSSQSAKYDARDQARVWKSFESSKRPTRMATLIKAAGEARFRAEESDSDYGDDIDLGAAADEDDLLGDAPEAKTDAPAADWMSLLDLALDTGAIKPTLHNVELIVRNDVRTAGLPAFNQFSQEVMLRRAPGVMKQRRKRTKATKQLTSNVWNVRDDVNGDLWIDSHDHGMRSIFEAPRSQGGYALKVSDRDLHAAVDIVAGDNTFHPVQEYLTKLKWDGGLRIDTLFTRYLGADDSTYTKSVSRLTMLGAVTRAFEPGHKFDFVPVLEGAQGKGKSTFIRILAHEWFSEIEGDFENRQKMVEKMQGSWILELPELQGFQKHEVAIIKAFVSAQTDKVRLAYAHRARNYDRQCIFMGSTNDSRYLRDATGGRRFWPVVCTVLEIDTDGLLREIDQLWAEAVAVYRAMRVTQPRGTLPLYLTNVEARAEAAQRQEDRRVIGVEDEFAGRIAVWLDKPLTDDLGFDDDDLLGGAEPSKRDEICAMQVWCEMLGRDESQYRTPDQQMLGRALALIPGWHAAGRRRIPKYGQQRVFRRDGATLEDTLTSD